MHNHRKVRTRDDGRQYGEIDPKFLERRRRTLSEDRPVLGEAVGRFEGRLAAFHEVEDSVGVGSPLLRPLKRTP